jgi:hypothetical protein
VIGRELLMAIIYSLRGVGMALAIRELQVRRSNKNEMIVDD